MDFFGINLNCPQYVDFESEFRRNNISLSNADDPSCSSVKELTNDMESDSMNIEDENANSYSQNESHLGSMQSSYSESYLDNSRCQDNVEESEYLAEEFPVNHLNPSKPDKNPEKGLKNNKTTRPKPFHLTESKKRKREDEHISLAEQVAAFHKKTPERFHTTGPKSYQPMKHWSPQLIHPKSPNLQAAKRLRGVNVLSREQEEAKEIEEMKRYKFRAQPVNHHVMQSPHLPNVRKKSPTKPKNLHLRTAQRAAEMHARKKEEVKPYEFHARPVPKSVLGGPSGVKEKSTLPVTEAKTPNFALKKRAEKWKSEAKLDETIKKPETFKAIPAPTPSSPFTVKLEKKRTEIQPFSFDSRDKERMIQKEQKIMEEIEKENRVYVFKAQPILSPTRSSLPAVPKKSVTQFQPFSFDVERRDSRPKNFNSSMDQTARSFKAQPAKVLEKAPFIPEKSQKQPVEVKEFTLHTDIRASEREKLKEINDMKEREKELALQNLRELQEEEERKEILRLRKEAVHKANPIRHFKPVEIKPSSKPPTQPISPKFKTDERLRPKYQMY